MVVSKTGRRSMTEAEKKAHSVKMTEIWRLRKLSAKATPKVIVTKADTKRFAVARAAGKRPSIAAALHGVTGQTNGKLTLLLPKTLGFDWTSDGSTLTLDRADAVSLASSILAQL